MGRTFVWVAVAIGIGLSSGFALAVVQFLLVSLGLVAAWTLAASYARLSLWSWAAALICILVAVQFGYVSALAMRAYSASRRRRTSRKV